jgi:hypothetical protein
VSRDAATISAAFGSVPLSGGQADFRELRDNGSGFLRKRNDGRRLTNYLNWNDIGSLPGECRAVEKQDFTLTSTLSLL